MLPQALEIIFEVQRKRSNEKIATRKISFSTHKTRFFFLFSSCVRCCMTSLACDPHAKDMQSARSFSKENLEPF